MPLFPPANPLRKNDVLASTLLFATLAISIVEQAFMVVYYYWDQVVYAVIERKLLIWQLLAALLQAAFYLAIRRGMFRAKVVVLVVCAYLAYGSTHLQSGHLAGVSLTHLAGYSLLVLFKDLLVLAALVLMFTKPQTVAPSGT